MKKWKVALQSFLFCMCLTGTAYANEWRHDDGGWWYQTDNGSYLANGFADIDGNWYHFQDNGYMSVGWVQANGKWYYMDANGAMIINGYTPDGNYYLDANGVWDGSGTSNQNSSSQTGIERNTAILTVDGEEQVFYLTSTTQYTSKIHFTATGLKNGTSIGPQFVIEIDPSVSAGTTYTTSDNDQEIELTYYKTPGGTRYVGKSKPYYPSTGRQSRTGGSGSFSCTITKNETTSNGIHVAGTFTSTLSKYPLASSQKAEKHEVNGSFDFYEGEQVDWVKQKLTDRNKAMREVERELDGYDNSNDNSDSSSYTYSTHNCLSCKGTGRCTICGGDGLNRLGSDDGSVHKCHTCKGTGKCQVCYGTGKVY